MKEKEVITFNGLILESMICPINPKTMRCRTIEGIDIGIIGGDDLVERTLSNNTLFIEVNCGNREMVYIKDYSHN